MIDSKQNQRVKYVKRLQNDRRFRTKEEIFVIEGNRWLQEVAQRPELVTAVYHTPQWLENPEQAELLASIDALKTAVSPAIMQEMSDTETPAGILATVQMPPATLPRTLTFFVILDQLNDPGNMGTIVRTSAAAHVDAVLLAPGCVDLYNPKVVRSTAGTLLNLPILSLSWSHIAELCQQTAVYALDAHAEQRYTAVDWRQPSGLIVGNEAHGLSQEAQQVAQTILSIPMNPKVESLNASMAAGIVLFEAVRQKLG